MYFGLTQTYKINSRCTLLKLLVPKGTLPKGTSSLRTVAVGRPKKDEIFRGIAYIGEKIKKVITFNTKVDGTPYRLAL